MSSSTTSGAIPIPDPLITESFCLLSPSSLPSFPAALGEVVFLQYPLDSTAQFETQGVRGRRHGDRVVDFAPGGGAISRSSTNQLEDEEITNGLSSAIQAKYEMWPRDWNTLQSWEPKKTLWVKADDSNDVKILYTPYLEQEVVKAVIGASCPDVKFPELDSLLKPRDGTEPSLITGLRLRTTRHRTSGLEYLVLFLGIPYLAGPPTGSGGSLTLTLSQYHMHNFNKPGSEYSRIRVWQAWHILFDNSRIALFKSPDEPSTVSPSSATNSPSATSLPSGSATSQSSAANPPSATNPPPANKLLSAPLFPFQERFGAFHTLAQLLGNIFLHEVTVLSSFKECVSREEGELLEKLEKIKAADIKGFDEQVKKFDEGVKNFDKRLTDLSTILIIIADQLKILKDFQTILGNHQRPGKRPATCNAVQFPALGRQNEQINATLRVLEALVTERTEKITTLEKWRMELRKTREGLHSGASLGTSVAMKGILARQGQTVTVFALITATFLPLNFFASYLGMNSGVWSGVNTHEEFWRITGPITVVLVALLSYFMFRNDDDIKEDLSRFNILNRAWREYKKRSEEDGAEKTNGKTNGDGGLEGAG